MRFMSLEDPLVKLLIGGVYYCCWSNNVCTRAADRYPFALGRGILANDVHLQV